MKISFHTKFKDRIHIVDKRGLKHALLSQPNEPQLRSDFSKLNNKMDEREYNKLTQYKRSYTKTEQSETPKKKYKRSVKFQPRQQNQSRSQNKKSEFQYNNKKSGLKYNLSQVKDDQDNLFQKTTLSRNPQVESLAIKLKQKQKQKFKAANQPKYIDEMIIKHQNLFKMLDNKKQSLSTTKQLRRIQKQKNYNKIPKQLTLISQSSLINQNKTQQNLGLSQPTSPTSIKLKRIEQIIMQTHLNRQKQRQQSHRDKSQISGNSQYCFLYQNNIKNRNINQQKCNPHIKGISTYQNSLRNYQPSGLDTLDSVYSINININGSYLGSSKKKNTIESPINQFPKIKKPWTNIFTK